MTSTAAISEFYDQFNVRLLRDYVYGNVRLNMAIEFITSVVPSTTRRVLDIGCGIGTTSIGMANRFPGLNVVGVDISEQNVETAKQLSSGEGVWFLRSDMTETPPGGPFDVATLIDVYEHIPVAARSVFHRSVSAALSDDGIVVLTTPSRNHQEWLAKHQPDGLQIVDEIIEREQVEAFASDVDADVLLHEAVDVWTPGQYNYTVLSRGPQVSVELPKPGFPRFITLETGRRIEALYKRLWDSKDVKQRRQQVRDTFGIDVERKSHRWVDDKKCLAAASDNRFQNVNDGP